MMKQSYRDIIIVLTLTILSLVWLTIPALNVYPLNIIPYILILGFLSGYSLLVALKPLIYEIGVVKRVLFSLILSFLLTVSIALFSSYTPLKTLNISTIVFIPFLIIILSIIASIRRGRYYKKLSSSKIEDEVVISEKQIPEPEKIEEKTSAPKIVNQVKPESGKISRKRFYSMDILLVLLFTILCAVFVLVPILNKTFIRTILGLFLILFLPGYALIAALFPKLDDLDSIERLALSFGLSIAITPLLGLALNYTPYGIRLDPILLSLTGVTLIFCGVAYWRRRLLPVDSRFWVDFGGFFKSLRSGYSGESRIGRILSVILIISIIGAVVATVYIIVEPKQGESFTEFYILGPGGMASNYPTNLTSGQEGNLIIGIVNHENKKVSYHLVVTSGGVFQMDQIISLDNKQKVEIPFKFTAGDPGTRRMDFVLYKLPDNNNIYRSLHLFINITSSENISSSTGSGSNTTA